MLNRTILVGRLTRDLELKRTQSGHSYIQFSLAVNRPSTQPGMQDVDYIDCVAWDKKAENMNNSLHKGSLIGIVGRLSKRSYDTQQGERRYITEVIVNSVSFLEPKNNGVQNSYQQPMNNSYQQQGYQQPVNNSYPQNQGYSNIQYGESLTASAERQTFEDTLDIDSGDLPF